MANSDGTKVTTPDYYISGNVDGKEMQWGPGEWMRPLGHVEGMFAIGGYLNSCNTAQAIWVSSEKPLTRPIMMEALQHLVQRIPVLNVCIHRRGSQLWYRRLQKTVIDFDIFKGDTIDVFNKVQAGSYDLSEGPLWRVRMVQLTNGEKSPRGVTAQNHTMIVFGIQHSITDGTTNLILCRELVRILNDLYQGKPISSKLYRFASPSAEKLVASSMGFLMKFMCNYFFNVFIADFNNKTTFRGLLPLPKSFIVETKILQNVFTKGITDKLIASCKKNTTTVHSCIVTAANAAYFDIASQKTLDRLDEVTMYYVDCINLQRYYPQKEHEHIGCKITMHEQKNIVTTDSWENFWNTARCSKAVLHKDISNRACLNVIPILKSAAVILAINNYHNRRGSVNVTTCHYITTNMGDVTNLLEDNASDEQVQITDMFRSVSGEHGGHLFNLTFHTYKGRFYLSIDYFGNKMSDTHAQEFFDDLCQKITNLAEKGMLR